MPPKQHIVAHELEKLLDTATPSTFFGVLSQMRALVITAKARKTDEKLETIPASSLADLEDAVHLTGIKCLYGSEESRWELPASDPSLPRAPLHHACEWLETALSDFRNSTFWHSKSGEALCRTPIDMILFDRLSLQQNEHGARNLIFLRERPITATVLDKKRMISGVADYVIGYDYASCDGSNVNLEYTLVVIEAKKGTILPKGRAQVAVYLAGIQQKRRLAKKIAVNVYGIVTDGLTYEFLCLDHDLRLRISRPYHTGYDDQRQEMYRFVDAILTAAVRSSPHTTPSKNFPDHQTKWTHSIERKVFDLPDEVIENLPPDWEKYLDSCSCSCSEDEL